MRKLNVIELNRISVEQYKQSRKTPLTIVLDNVRSTYNVGSIFRTADALRIESIQLCGITPRPPHPEIHKTALGAELSVDSQYNVSTLELVNSLKAKRYIVMAVEQVEGSISLPKFADEMDKLRAKMPDATHLAIVVGHEVHGVKQEVVDACHACIEIPQYGTKHSLNVSSAAAIVMWEISQYLHSIDI